MELCGLYYIPCLVNKLIQILFIDKITIKFQFKLGRAIFKAEHWKAYVAVNKLFALKTIEAVERCYKESPSAGIPIVWVHDYHLMLAANYIREYGETKNLQFQLGFFLHIPFSTRDILR